MIPQIQPWIDQEEAEQLMRVVSSTYVTEGPLTTEFEQKLAQYTRAEKAMAVNNGTMALYMCLKALDIGPGDEVIVPDITFVATANAVILAGAIPVVAPIDRYLGLDPDKIADFINHKTKAIIPVHLYGQACRMDELMNIARKYDLLVIEDAAQGVGVKYKKTHVGLIGDIGILSFYGNKTITTGEGGAILFNEKSLENLYSKCYRLKNHGRDVKGVFKHEHIGYNFSFTDMQAAIGIAQLGKLTRIIRRKEEIFTKYFGAFWKKTNLDYMPINPDGNAIRWFSSFYAPTKQYKESLVSFLDSKGIQTRACFYPLHAQPCYEPRTPKIIIGRNKVYDSFDYYNRMLSFPSSYGLTIGEQDQVIEATLEFDSNYEN